MYGDAPRAKRTGVPGWETEAEQELLYNLAADVPAGGRILEIGGEFGMSASLFLAATTSPTEVITIDLFPDDLLMRHVGNLEEAKVHRLESVQYVGDSRVLGATWDQPVDLLFIDGDHSYDGALTDLNLFTQHVNVGGVVAIHDTANVENKLPHILHYEVTRAVNAWLQGRANWQITHMVDSTMVFKRLDLPVPTTERKKRS